MHTRFFLMYNMPPYEVISFAAILVRKSKDDDLLEKFNTWDSEMEGWRSELEKPVKPIW